MAANLTVRPGITAPCSLGTRASSAYAATDSTPTYANAAKDSEELGGSISMSNILAKRGERYAQNSTGEASHSIFVEDCSACWPLYCASVSAEASIGFGERRTNEKSKLLC